MSWNPRDRRHGALVGRAIFRSDEDGVIPAGTKVILFDANDRGNAPSVVAEPEPSLVRRVFEPLGVGHSVLLQELGLDRTTSISFGVGEPFVRSSKSRPGDIDLLLIPTDPRLTIAIEVKRLKVRTRHEAPDHINKLQGDDVPKGVDQAWHLNRVGFSSTWLMLLCVSDARDSEEVCTPLRGARTETRTAIEETLFAYRSRLEGIGVLLVEVVQLNGHALEDGALVDIDILQIPNTRDQDSRITQLIVNYLSR